MTLSSEEPNGSKTKRRRRRWADEDKRRIIAECEAPGSSVSIVARRHDLNANLLFTWRRQLAQEQSECGPEPTFVPAVVAPPNEVHPLDPAIQGQPEHRHSIKDGSGRRTGVIEIVLAGGRRVIVEERVSAAALARVIGVLEGR